MRPVATDGAEVHVRLLGEATVTRAGSLLAGFDSVRVQQFMGRLALSSGVPQSRARIAFELWPDSSDQQARTNLRHLLYDLRRALPDLERFVEVTNQSVRWCPGAATVDVISFVDAVDRGALQEAADWYGGDLLPACYDDWTQDERARLREMAMATLAQLAVSDLRGGNPGAAVGHARRLLQLDPLHEPGHRLLMRALAENGDRAGALRAYHACVDLLARELGVGPAEETRLLYGTFHDRTPNGASDPIEARSPTHLRPPLIGRAAPWGTVVETMAAVAAGRARLLVVEGEPGIGKSRLLEELTRSLAGSGTRTARTRAYEAAGRLPWAPVVDWLRAPMVRATLAGLPWVWLAEVARLVPELRAEQPELPVPVAFTDAALRHRLFDAVAHALVAVASPLVLVIDDMQWCDDETLELIEFLLRAAPDAPLLVAGTARTEEVDDDHPLARLLRRLEHDGNLTRVRLDRLDRDATVELAGRLRGPDLDVEAGNRLYAETEGNPLFVLEAIRAGFPDTTSGRVSSTVQAVIAARLARLSSDAREALEAAATIGRQFSVEILAPATGRSERDLVGALDELWRRHIIQEQVDAYDFTHDKVREVAYAMISPARRRHLHRMIAAALASQQPDDPGAVSAQVAAHYEQAGMPAESIAAYRRAADASIAVFALDDAIGLLSRGVAALERMPAGRARDELEVDMRIELGVPLVAREGYGSLTAYEGYLRAVTLSRRIGRSPAPPVLRGLGLDAIMHCRLEETSDYGLALLDQVHLDPTAETEGHYLLGVSAFWLGALPAARSHLEAALSAYRPERSAEHIARYAQDPKAVCLVRLGLTELWAGNIERATDLTEQALAYAVELDHPTTYGYVLMYAALIAAELGDYTQVAHRVAAGDDLWARQQLGFFMSLGDQFRAWLDILDGDPTGVRSMEAVIDAWRNDDASLHLTYGLALLARAHAMTGDIDAGGGAIHEAMAWMVDHDQRYLESELWRLDGELLAMAGDTRGAVTAVRRALAVAKAQGARVAELRAATALVRIAPSETSFARLRRLLQSFSAGPDTPDTRLAAGLLAGR